MAFLSRSVQQEDLGSGGKALHCRRYPSRFSPYSRPSSSVAPVALLEGEPEARGSPSWFRGLISGAGKLVSSVLGSGSGSSSECSSDYSSDEEYEPLPNERGNHSLSDDLAGSNKRGSVVEGDVEPLAIVSKSESKLVIEQLLLQETFTRDEYSKLMEILRSRVVDIPSTNGGEVIQEEFSEGVSKKSPWQPLNKAVMEAKKWFKDKKISPSTICDQECGPYMLKTDMNQYFFNSNNASPVEMAKSYMQSLPPWRSPSFSTSGFKNSSSSGKHTYCSTASHLLLSSEVKERAYSAIGSLQSSRVFSKSVADERGSSKLKQGGSATEPPLFEDSSGGGDIFSAELRLHDREPVEIGHRLDTHTQISQGSIADLQGAFKGQELPKIASENFFEQPHSDIDGIVPCDSDVFMSDKNQDVEMPSVIEAQTDNISAPHDSLPMYSMTDRNDGDSFPETETFQSENVFPSEPRILRSKKNAIQAIPDSDFKHANSLIDSQPPESNPHIPKGAVIMQEETNTDGSMSKRGSTTTYSTNGYDVVASNVSEAQQPPSNVSGKIPGTQAISGSASERPNDTEPSQPGRGRGRGRGRAKKVGRQKKWKG